MSFSLHSNEVDPEAEDRPFAMGMMIGIRSYDIRSHRLLPPYLEGIHFPQRLIAGENLAVCDNFQVTPSWSRPERLVQLGHTAGIQRCTCGFYAYYNSRYNDYARTTTVTAIVGGYGVVSYSDRGFRCQKLKPLALVNPYLQTGRIRATAREKLFRSYTPVTQLPVYEKNGILAVSDDVEPKTFRQLMDAYRSIDWFPTVEEALKKYPLSTYKETPAVRTRESARQRRRLFLTRFEDI